MNTVPSRTPDAQGHAFAQLRAAVEQMLPPALANLLLPLLLALDTVRQAADEEVEARAADPMRRQVAGEADARFLLRRYLALLDGVPAALDTVDPASGSSVEAGARRLGLTAALFERMDDADRSACLGSTCR